MNHRWPIAPIVAVFFLTLVVTDAVVFNGESSRAVWQEAVNQVNSLNTEVVWLLRKARH